ncbi:hypothetical protein HRbin11_00206 [bacterium HR11]|nr:hypothetical protein HRbin11_00206 [bacterium HR11]
MKRVWMTAVCVLGIGWGLYALWAERQVHRGTTPLGCGIQGSVRCDVVLTSPYANWLGVPLPAWALVLYGGLLILLWRVRSAERVGVLFAWASLGAVLTSAGLFWIMRTRLGAVCPICYTGYAINLLLLVSTVIGFGPVLRRLPAIWRRDRALRRWVLVLSVGAIALAGWGYRQNTVSLERLSSRTLPGPTVDEDRAPVATPYTGGGTPYTGGPKAGLCTDEPIPADWAEFLQAPPPPVEIPTGVCNYLVGGPDSPVQVVEFIDFQCPVCAQMAFILDRLAEEFQGRLGIQVCHFPLDPACNPSVSRPVHPLACELAAIAECAAAQGRLRAVHDEMFMYQPSIALWLEGRIPGASTASAFGACATAPATQERVRRQVELGLRLNIAGTPTVFLNGVLLRGGLVPPSVLCRLIRQALGRPTSPG